MDLVGKPGRKLGLSRLATLWAGLVWILGCGTQATTNLAQKSRPDPFGEPRLLLAVVYSDQTFPWTSCRSVRRSVHAYVCPVHCGKMVDRVRMPFGIIGQTGPGMRQAVGFGDRSMGRGTFGGEFGAPL